MNRRKWISLALAAGVLILTVALFGPRLARQGWQWRKDQQLDQFAPLIDKQARAAGLSPDLVAAVVWAESGGNPSALSNKNAKGLMQITPVTEKDVLQRNSDISRGDLNDPDYNLRIGTVYLAHLLKRFGSNRKLALAAYHMGPTRLRRKQQADRSLNADALLAKHAGPQTRAYVKRVLERLD